MAQNHNRTEPTTLSVSELNAAVKQSLESQFRTVWVVGEISDIARPRSGHVYFTLKDAHSQVRVIVWRSVIARLPFELEDGLSVLCKASVDVYLARGTYQLVVQTMEIQGVGSMQIAFRQLHLKLEQEGLFDPERKRQVPSFPKHVGLVTSPTGAAARDFLEVARRRWPSMHVLLIPTQVQGNDAPREIVSAIRAAQSISPRLDVLVIGRGGGSLEDLWSFNNEHVVRAIANSSIPTITAIGHEIDITLSDLASDKRALTPSEAAELAIPSRSEMVDRFQSADRQLHSTLANLLKQARGRVDELAETAVIRFPFRPLGEYQRLVDEAEAAVEDITLRQISDHRQTLQSASAILDAVSPLKVMSRGYSITRDSESGTVLRKAADTKAGELLETQFLDGTVRSQVL